LQSVAESNLPNGSRRLTAHLTCRNCSIKFVTSGTTASGNGGGTTRWRRTIRLGRSSDGLDASALKHRSEWVYTSGQMSLMVNSRPTLGVTFNRHHDQRLTAAYFGYDSNHLSASSAAQHLFSIVYNSFGQPLSVVPNAQKSFFRPVYFKYTDRNQLSEMRWADKPRTASESTAREGWLQRQYDSAGRLVSEARNFSSGSAASSDDLAVHRFGYSDNSSMPGRISDPAGQTYRFERDPSTGGLGRLVTPTGTIRLRAHSSLSSNRLLYWPWLGTARAAVFHYNADEALESVLYPSRQRR
uniref:RHS repeat protein n=1 Tax=Macrostomum lignano TaxID=282301 RepID=A0A1I8G4F9_9PLAT